MEIIEISKLLIEKFSDSIEFSEDSTFIKAQPKQWEDIALFIKDDIKKKGD